MKKLVVIITILILFIPKVNASTSSASSYILMDSTTGRVPMSKDIDVLIVILHFQMLILFPMRIGPLLEQLSYLF
mgnify:CR=1 FL=1